MNQTPNVIRLGSLDKKDIKKLKNGHGTAATEISQVAAMTKASNASAKGQEIHPVILVYREKKKKKKNIKIGPMKIKRKRLKKMGFR